MTPTQLFFLTIYLLTLAGGFFFFLFDFCKRKLIASKDTVKGWVLAMALSQIAMFYCQIKVFILLASIK